MERKSMSKQFVVGIAVLTLFGHVLIVQNNRLEQMKIGSELSERAEQINNDQIRDLLAAIQQLKTEKESIANQSFVSGVVSTLQDHDHYDRIWHDGYDRGTEVQMLAFQAEKEAKPVARGDLPK